VDPAEAEWDGDRVRVRVDPEPSSSRFPDRAGAGRDQCEPGPACV